MTEPPSEVEDVQAQDRHASGKACQNAACQGSCSILGTCHVTEARLVSSDGAHRRSNVNRFARAVALVPWRRIFPDSKCMASYKDMDHPLAWMEPSPTSPFPPPLIHVHAQPLHSWRRPPHPLSPWRSSS